MEELIKEYNLWLKENQHFILHLKEHESTLFTRLSPIYVVLNYFTEEIQNKRLVLDEDIYKIFQVGFEYLHSQIYTCKLYLENTFKNNFHDFLNYDNIIGYILYLEDLRYEVLESGVDFDESLYNKSVNKLEEIMNKAQKTPENINLLIDSEVHNMVDTDKWDFHSIIDIFVEIAETLEIELYTETDYVIGKDI